MGTHNFTDEFKRDIAADHRRFYAKVRHSSTLDHCAAQSAGAARDAIGRLAYSSASAISSSSARASSCSSGLGG